MNKKNFFNFLSSSTSPWVGILVGANLGLIGLLGLAMMTLSKTPEFFMITLIIMGTSGGMVALLMAHIKALRKTIHISKINAEAYENSPFPQCIYDRHQSMNLNACARTHLWCTDIKHLRAALSRDKDHRALDTLLKASQEGKIGIELIELNGDGKKTWWNIHTTPHQNTSLWTFQPLTHKQDIPTHTQDLENFFDQAPDGFLSMNQEGDIVLCNEALAQWLGYTSNDLIGTPFYKLLPEHTRNRTQNPKKLAEVQGFCEFLTASQRFKSAYMEQQVVATTEGFRTYTIVHLTSHHNLLGDMDKLLNITPIPVAFLDDQLMIRKVNLPFKKAYGSEFKELRDTPFLRMIQEDTYEDIKRALEHALIGEDSTTPVEVEFNDTQESVASLYLARVTPTDDHAGGLFLQFHDITEQRKIETQLAQSQKMQAVGQLAGGVAHDFNNLLTAMIGFCDLLLQRHSPGDQSFTDIMQIKQNANRAANLVRQLLAFSRQQTLQPRILNITDALDELSSLLRRLIGSNIELKIKHIRNLGLVLVDQGQFEQVIINLVVNARDAMETGGTISISTQNITLKRPKRKSKGVGVHMDTIPAGDYVLLEIEDSGQGIAPDILDRIFDPFFSTKEKGSGTGLGLSTVYGIVKQTGGFIMTESILDKGTKFSIYLPRQEAVEDHLPTAIIEPMQKNLDLSGHHSILLVEDEDAVRLFSTRALRSKGYTVFEARNGLEALHFMKEEKAPIDLVITDVVMPQMDGPTFVNEVVRIYPHIQVLFISGYTEDTFRDRLKDDHNIQFLAKPFSLQDLAQQVKSILKSDIPRRLAS